MGGFGSGQWYRFSTKDTVEECSALSIGTFKDALRYVLGYRGHVWWTVGDKDTGDISFQIDQVHGQPAIRLLYTITNRIGGEQRQYDYVVSLQTTQPHFGGVRWWFICPLVVGGRPCRRRVAKLYLPRNGEHFGCRHCHDLVYQSQREDRPRRLLWKAQGIRIRLGGHPGVIYPFPDKPRGMHWQTYWRLRRESQEAAQGSLSGTLARSRERLATLRALRDGRQ